MADATVTKQAGATPGQPLYEAAGLAWLAEGGARVPKVIEATRTRLVTERIDEAAPTAEAARQLGAMLARMHASCAPWFGAPPPGYPDPARHNPASGWMGAAPLPLLTAPSDSASTPETAGLPEAVAPPQTTGWGHFYANYRIRPYLAHTFTAAEKAEIEAFCALLESGALDHPQPQAVREAGFTAARIHGDLWSGNIMWGRSGPTLIDPAAQGGHAEEDLATLHTFGAPHLAHIIAGYQEVSPLAPGWEQRVGLHQLHILTVHCYLFGRSYVPQTMAAVRGVPTSAALT